MKISLQFTTRRFYGAQCAALEDREQNGRNAPSDAKGSDVKIGDPEDCNVSDPTFIHDDDLDKDE